MNIIQTYKTADIPDEYKPFVESVKKHNPDWNYMFFSDDDIVAFFKTDAPEYYSTFCNLKYKIQQLDFFRYCAIYCYGGVYLDLDIMINKSFNDIDLNACMFPLESRYNYDTLLQAQDCNYSIGQYAFYAPKNDPFIKLLIDNITMPRISAVDLKAAMDFAERQGASSIPRYVYYTTGPVFVTQTYLDYGKNIKIIGPDVLEAGSFGNYGKHHQLGSWKSVRAISQPTMK